MGKSQTSTGPQLLIQWGAPLSTHTPRGNPYREMMCSGWTLRSYMLMGHLGKHPTGGNVDPELKREVWVPVQGRERSEPQAGDGGDAGGSSASCGC